MINIGNKQQSSNRRANTFFCKNLFCFCCWQKKTLETVSSQKGSWSLFVHSFRCSHIANMSRLRWATFNKTFTNVNYNRNNNCLLLSAFLKKTAIVWVQFFCHLVKNIITIGSILLNGSQNTRGHTCQRCVQVPWRIIVFSLNVLYPAFSLSLFMPTPISPNCFGFWYTTLRWRTNNTFYLLRIDLFRSQFIMKIE